MACAVLCNQAAYPLERVRQLAVALVKWPEACYTLTGMQRAKRKLLRRLSASSQAEE
jgi:hypothetical protein